MGVVRVGDLAVVEWELSGVETTGAPSSNQEQLL
jgi:hypothetical protein